MIDDFTKGAPPDKRPSENEVREAFNKLDADNSGSLELPEIDPLVKGIFQDLVNNMWWTLCLFDFLIIKI